MEPIDHSLLLTLINWATIQILVVVVAEERSHDPPIIAVLGRSQDPLVVEEADLPVEEEEHSLVGEEEPHKDSPKGELCRICWEDLATWDSLGGCRCTRFVGRISQQGRSSSNVPHQDSSRGPKDLPQEERIAHWDLRGSHIEGGIHGRGAIPAIAKEATRH